MIQKFENITSREIASIIGALNGEVVILNHSIGKIDSMAFRTFNATYAPIIDEIVPTEKTRNLPPIK